MLPVPPPSRHFLPPAFTLTGIEAKLQNYDMWSSFAPHGTEMIITKSGRRMFPSVRVTLSGLEDDASYCLMLEMVPIGDCRYKFSGSQWVPAGGAEPQSPQRMYLHPDSPALGSHWNSQPVSFSKVKLTNNTLDSNGHVVLTSMHKYKPRLHVIRTSEPSQIPWSPSQVFFFQDTDFVAVTAYQNDNITKLKIDNNPFAKGFRETGQSRCKRKSTITNGSSAGSSSVTLKSNVSLMGTSLKASKSDPTMAQTMTDEAARHPPKRKRTNSSSGSVSSLDDSGLSICGSSSRTSSPSTNTEDASPTRSMATTAPSGVDVVDAMRGLPAPPETILQHYSAAAAARSNWIDFALYFSRVSGLPLGAYQHPVPHHHPQTPPAGYDILSAYGPPYPPLAAATTPFGGNVLMHLAAAHTMRSPTAESPISPTHHGGDSARKSSFTIDAILGREEQN
ncbi:T-box transcription factor TBX2b-like isoform X2 [Lutzomyia longipalpis]|nr:T-box transcription factor TBX2b-like isoform X2 [Lutzomyia longipalpis]XP_055691081.1 T-box transcription factor TBX2b-like isoform X2 [Lutzomyia longipalpis]